VEHQQDGGTVVRPHVDGQEATTRRRNDPGQGRKKAAPVLDTGWRAFGTLSRRYLLPIPVEESDMRLRLIVMSLSVIATNMSFSAGSFAEGDEMEQQGRWVYSDSPTPAGKESWVAMTSALETSQVWLGFWCSDDPTVFASIYDSRGVAIGHSELPVKIVLQDGASLDVALHPENNQIGIFAADLSERLFLYAIHAEKLKVIVPDKQGGRNSYTFLLQPSDVALKFILKGCVQRKRNGASKAPSPRQ
jgi:hypothetical protein